MSSSFSDGCATSIATAMTSGMQATIGDWNMLSECIGTSWWLLRALPSSYRFDHAVARPTNREFVRSGRESLSAAAEGTPTDIIHKLRILDRQVGNGI
mmetsp:Transcript_4801/g.10589  ORF Transcript_4801/g.10589 Transcript_4801/m.10589 type:complete len:98 (-) Transcript_4801:2-295(-)